MPSDDVSQPVSNRIPWNKGKLTGPKPPLRPKNVWSIRTRLQVEGRIRDLAMFNFAIDSKLRACDVVRIKMDDVAPHGRALNRVTIRQKKTGQPVTFELTDQSRQSIDEYIRVACKNPGDFLFASRKRGDRAMSTRQYARIVSTWIAGIGLDPSLFGTHSLRRTKATLIYRRTGNLRAVQLLLGHTKVESTAISGSRWTMPSPLRSKSSSKMPGRADMLCPCSVDLVASTPARVRALIPSRSRARRHLARTKGH